MRRIQQLSVIAALGVTLGSCGIYDKYHPVTEVPEQLFGTGVTPTDSASLGTLGWQEMFTDPQLADLIREGLERNTDYRTAQLKVKEAEAVLLSSKLAYLPSLALSPQGVVSSFDRSKAIQTYTLPVTANWELDLFGKLRNAKRQAQAALAQSQDYRQAVRTQLIAGIANTYYTLLMLDAQVDIATETQTSWQESLASIQALMQAGQANETAVAQIEAAYYAVCSATLDLKEQRNQVENTLALLLARTPGPIGRGRIETQTLPATLSTGIPMELLSHRPDVRMAQRSVEQAFYATQAARSAFYPSITLSGTAGWSNSSGALISNPAKFLASAVGSLTQPLFARGQLAGQLKIAKAQQEEARLGFEQTLLTAGTEVNEALEQCQTAHAKAELFERQIAALDKACTASSLLMQHGTATYLDVLTARQSLLEARLTQVANRFSELQGVVNLYHALGGGTE